MSPIAPLKHALAAVLATTHDALTTLGANTSSVARRRLNLLAYAVAGIVTIGFLLPPYAILFGLVK